MLVFPPAPNVGDEANGLTWDGVKWICGGSLAISVPQPDLRELVDALRDLEERMSAVEGTARRR